MAAAVIMRRLRIAAYPCQTRLVPKIKAALRRSGNRYGMRPMSHRAKGRHAEEHAPFCLPNIRNKPGHCPELLFWIGRW
jgi:hypothetical protein